MSFLHQHAAMAQPLCLLCEALLSIFILLKIVKFTKGGESLVLAHMLYSLENYHRRGFSE